MMRNRPQPTGLHPPERQDVFLGPPLVRRLTRWLFAFIAFLAVGNLVSLIMRHGFGRERVFGLVSFFDLHYEESLGTWFAALILVGAAVLALLAGGVDRRAGGVWRRNWWLLAAVFVLMSIDEVGTLHEGLASPVREALGTGGALFFAWVIPIVALGAVFLLVQLRFLRHLPPATRSGLIVAGGIFVAGAAGMEMVESAVYVPGDNSLTLQYGVLAMIEELLELVAVVLAVRTLGLHLTAAAGRIKLTWGQPVAGFTRLRPWYVRHGDAAGDEQAAGAGELAGNRAAAR